MSDNIKNISRREFLKAAGLATGGVALGSLSLLTACQGATGTTKATALVTSATDATTAASTSTAPAGGLFVPPNNYPSVLKETYGCTARVADDRWYTDEHTWIKEWDGDKVVIGITDKMQEITSTITLFIFTLKEGDVVERGKLFAIIEAHKLNTDICAPVSGKIIQQNHVLSGFPGDINNFPYTKGWMIVMQLTNPKEMDDLIGPNYYAYLQAKEIPPTIPPVRS